jgi:hypothetical protein
MIHPNNLLNNLLFVWKMKLEPPSLTHAIARLDYSDLSDERRTCTDRIPPVDFYHPEFAWLEGKFQSG